MCPARAAVAALAALAASAVGLAAPEPAAAAARIVAPPSEHAIVTGPSLRVVAAVPRTARGLEARIGDEDVSDRMRRRSDGRYAGRIPTGLAGGPGFHFLRVNYVDRTGRHSLGRELIVARQRQRAHRPRRGPRLLALEHPGRPVAGVARLHLRAPRADQWSVRVNGRDQSARFADHAGFPRDGSLSASTGLRRGANRVAVIAARNDGSHAVRRFTVRVRPRSPIPDAGPPRRVAAGDLVRLGSPGGAAEPSRPGNVLEHEWTIVSAPRRSAARLRHPRAERPSFRPDVRGSYRIADRVTERTPAGALVGRSARDVVEVAATPPYVPPIGVPLETLVVRPGGEGGRTVGIELGGRFHPQERWSQDTFQVLSADPATMAVTSETFDTAGEALGHIESLAEGTIVAVQGGSLPEEASWIEGISRQLGAPGNWAAPAGGGTPTFSAIGTKGIPVGQGWGNAIVGAPGNGTWGALRGYVAPNYKLSTEPEHATYTFTPSTYFTYDTNTTGAGEGATSVTARVGTAEVTGTVPSGQAGFLAAEFDAGTLEPLSHQSFAIAPAGRGEDYDQGEVEALAKWLEERESDPHGLVLLQSIGALAGAPQDTSGSESFPLVEAWARASRAIGSLGGHQNLFNTIDGGGYSFLGGAALPTAGVAAAENGTTLLSYAKPSVFRLAGTIQLGHVGTLVPATNTPITTPGASAASNPTAVGNFELPVIAYQEPTSWPYEAGFEKGPYESDPAVVAAVHFISREICEPTSCGDEVRRLYPESDYDLEGLIETADHDAGFRCPAAGGEWEGTAFTREDCQAALAELEREYRWILHLREYFSTGSEGILFPFSAVVGKKEAGLEAIGNKIEAAIHPPAEAKTEIAWAIIFQSLATALEALDLDAAPAVTAFATELDAGLNLAQAWAAAPGGESVLEIETTVDQAVEHVDAMAAAQEASIANLFGLIVTDYGKLSGMYANTSGKYKQWNPPTKDWPAVEEQLTYAMRGAFYRTFLPAFSETRTEPNGDTFYGYRDVTLPQNVCISHSDAGESPVPMPPSCGGASSPTWGQVWDLSGAVCWDYYLGAWHTEKMGEHWAGAENVVAGQNALGEITYNPYDGGSSSGAQVFGGYSPVWHVAIRPERPFSSGEAPFPAAVAREMSGRPEPGNLNGGLPPWALFESLEPEEVTLCPGEWEGF